MALSVKFQELGRRDPYAAHRWLVESGLDERLEARLRTRLGRLLGADEGDYPRALTQRTLVVAAAKADHFQARQAPDFEAWLEGLAMPDIEERWFLGFDERIAARLRGFPLGPATLEEVAVWAVGRAIARLERYDPRRGTLLQFTHGIARRRALDLARRRRGLRRELELERVDARDHTLAEIDAADLAARVFELLRGCTRSERLVFRARLLGVEYELIAARLGYGVPSTHNVMNRVRRTLQRSLEANR